MKHRAHRGGQRRLIPDDDFEVPKVQIVRDGCEIDEHGMREQPLPCRNRDRRADRADQEEQCEDRPVGVDPLVLSGVASNAGNGPQPLDEQHQSSHREHGRCRRRHARAAPERPALSIRDPVRRQHAAREDVDHCRQLADGVQHRVGAHVCDGQPVAVGEQAQTREHHEGASPERPANHWKEQVELDFDTERPKRAADTAEGGEPQRMQKTCVCRNVHEPRGRRVEPRPVHKSEDDERHSVRRGDLFDSAHREIADARQRPPLEQVPRIGIEQAKAADEEEEIDAHKTGLRERLQIKREMTNRDRRWDFRDHPRVVPHDARNRDASQTIQDGYVRSTRSLHMQGRHGYARTQNASCSQPAA